EAHTHCGPQAISGKPTTYAPGFRLRFGFSGVVGGGSQFLSQFSARTYMLVARARAAPRLWHTAARKSVPRRGAVLTEERVGNLDLLIHAVRRRHRWHRLAIADSHLGLQ